MKNLKIAKILYEIADLLEIQGVEFKPTAYRRAARSIESLTRDIEEVCKEGGLEDIPGIGKNIAKKIEEIIKTGSLKYYEKLKKKIPIDVEELMNIEGIGPKTIKLLYKELKIRNLKDLENAVKKGRLKVLKGLGEVTEKNILDALQRKKEKRFLLGNALPIANDIVTKLKALQYVKEAVAAGSIRRMKETIGDIDILVISERSDNVMEFFTTMDDVERVLSKGPTRSSVILSSGIQVDLRVVEEKSFGSALMYFTGSKDHNIKLRKLAIEKKMKLSEYGLFKKDKMVAGKTEKEVYEKLGLDYIEPELREDKGEVEAAIEHRLPKLVTLQDIKGDLQMHTKWSDGYNTIKEMIEACKTLGYEYVAITDHVGALRIAHSLSKKQLLAQIKEIEKTESEIRVLKGMEVDIDKNGLLAVDKTTLKNFDIIVGSIHSSFKMDETKMTERLLKVIESGLVNIIAHPTGRKIGKKDAVKLDLEKIFDACKENNVWLEINSYPERLDLNEVNAKAAKEHGVNIVINTDAHSIEHLKNMVFGVAVARRAWLEKIDIINTLSSKKLFKILNRS